MANFMTVCKKELGDQLGSKRFLMLLALVIALGALSAYQGVTYIRSNSGASFMSIFTGSAAGFSFVTLMVYFGPIIGLALGFDAVNKERSSGTLSVLLTQPLYRDSILNGKFLAGVTALSLMAGGTIGIMVCLAVPMLGFGPSAAALTSIAFLILFTILYLALWLALSLLFSTVIKKTTTSILAAISTWLFFAFIVAIMASLVAAAVVPVSMPTGFQVIGGGGGGAGRFGAGGNVTITLPSQNETSSFQQQTLHRDSVESSIESISPTFLYSQVATTIIGTTTPGGGVFGFMTAAAGTPFRGLGTSQSIYSVWPQVAAIAVGLIICFVAAYMVFLRREIRAGG
jgi:ABC-2 type transport system permease protein